MNETPEILTRGALPFVGRQAELVWLHAFWRNHFRAQELRVALVVGEAGIGKSRLLEEFARRVEGEGGTVLLARLYPGATTSVVTLLEAALERARRPAIRIAAGGEESVSSLAAALRRLARIRPTLLVLEDIHLLGGASRAELVLLLAALSAEVVSVVCTGRSLPIETRGALEQYLADEIEVHGLMPDDVAGVWAALGGEEQNAEVLETLHQVSGGNPLALRSALRGAFGSNILSWGGTRDGFRVSTESSKFLTAIRSSVGLLAEGMLTHLTDEEKEAASKIASLGEQFARESARSMLEEADVIIPLLLEKGIIGHASAVLSSMPFQDPDRGRTFPTSRHRPLAFTHSLLHRHLLERADVEFAALLRSIGRPLPLYSVLPFQLVSEATQCGDIPLDELCATLNRALTTAFYLDSTSDWQMAPEILAAAQRLFELAAGRLRPDQHDEFTALIAYHDVLLSRRDNAGDRFRGLVARLLDVTVNPRTARLREIRLRALRYNHWIAANDNDYGVCSNTWNEVQRLVDEYEDLTQGRAFPDYLRAAMSAATRYGDHKIAAGVMQRLDQIITSDIGTEESRRDAWLLVAPYTLEWFTTADELDQRLDLLRRLDHADDGTDPRFRMCKILLLHSIGRDDDVRDALARSIPFFRERGESGYLRQCLLIEAEADALIAVEAEDPQTVIERLESLVNDPAAPWFGADLASRLFVVALVRGDGAACASLLDSCDDLRCDLRASERALLQLRLRDISIPVDPAILRDLRHDVAAELNDVAMDEASDQNDDDRLVSALMRPILRTYDIVPLRAAISIIEAEVQAAGTELSEQVKRLCRDAVVGILEWLDARTMPGPMSEVLYAHGSHLGSRMQESWRKKVSAAIDRRGATRLVESRTSVRITMIGTITVAMPGAAPQRIRGTRIRSFLALLVADRMLRTPLSPRDFSRLALDDEQDATKARDTVNLSVHRLRDVLGREAIITGEGTPRLNMEIVAVDMLEVFDQISRAALARREGSLMQAVDALREAMDAIGSDVPFPSLYTDFIEAARTDFECRLRDVLVSVASDLLQEREDETAASLLTAAIRSMPDDEDLSEMLREAYVRLGRRTDAIRV